MELWVNIQTDGCSEFYNYDLSCIDVVVLRIYVALAVFQPYRDLEEGDNQSLKFKWPDGDLRLFKMKT